MNLIFFAALIAACGAAKLDRTYLPPASAATAGGSPGILQTPFSRTSDQRSGIVEGVPPGGFVNQHQGVVVEAASVDTRASNKQSGLGAPRVSYGSSSSKVGDAAFRGTANQIRPASGAVVQGEPDLSAFHQPISSSKPGNFQIIRDYTSNTVKYQNDVGVNQYNYAFETDNGIKMSENGVSVDGVQAEGGYSYTGDDGRVYSVAYTAGDQGYRPSGAHLPTPPPIPQEILESLEQNARDEAAGLVDDGSYDAQKYNTEDDYTKNDAISKYNDRQSNKFGDRPGFGSSGFINQNQQAFAAPSSNGPFGFNGGFKDTTFSKPDSSKFGGTLTQNTNIFSSGNEYLPPYGAFKNPFVRPNSYDINKAGLFTSSAMSSQSSNSAPAKPFNQNPANHFGSVNFIQSSSHQTLQKKPGDGANFPISQGSLPNQPITSNSNTASNFGLPSQQFSLSNFQSSQNINSRFSESQPSSNVLGTYKPNLGVSFGSALNSILPTKQPELTLTTPLESNETSNASEQLTDQDSSKHEQSGITKVPHTVSQTSPFQTSAQINNDNNIYPIQSTSTATGDRKATDTGASSSELFPNKPISQNFGTQTSQSNQPQIFSPSQPNGSSFVSSTQRPNYSQTSQISQAQAADDSYLYNRPSKPFHAPSPLFETHLNKEPPYQINKDSSSGSLQEPIFTNPAIETVFSFNSQGSTKYPNPPTLAPSVQTQSNLQDGKREENVFQQNIGITQATVSLFPSLAPTSTTFKQPGQFGFNQVQQTVPNVSAFSQVGPSSATAAGQKAQEQSEIKPQDSNTITPIQQNNGGEIYEYNVPSQGLSPANSQPNQDLTIPFNNLITNTGSSSLESKFGQQSNSQLNNQDKPVQASQFGYQSGQQFALDNSAQKQDGDELNLKPNTKPLQFEQETSLNIGSTVSHQLPSVNQQAPFSQPEKLTTLPQNELEFGGKPQFGQEQSSSQLGQGNLDSNKEGSVSQFQQTNQQSIPSSLQTSTSFSTSIPITQFQQQAISSSFNKPSNQFFGSQDSLQFGQGETDNKETTVTQFQQSETQTQKPSKFFPSTFHAQPSSTPSSVTQPGLQSISTSFKKPSSQQLPNGSISGSQFGQGQFNKKGTTVPQSQQSVTQFGYKPSTISSSSLQSHIINTSTPKPFSQFGQFQTPGQKLQFGSQTGLQFGQTGLNNKVTTAPQFQQSNPSATGASSTQFQVGGFSTPSISSSSTIPTGQQSSFISQFGLGTLNNKGSTVPQIQSTNNKFDTRLSYTPSTSTTGSKFSQSGTFNAQRPSTQFGQTSFSLSSQLPTSQKSQNGIGSSSTFGHGSFDSKETTVSQFGTQSSYKPSTSAPGFTETQAFSANTHSTSNKFDQPSLPTSKTPNIQQSQLGQSGSIFDQSNFANKEASAPKFQESSQQPGTFASRPSTPVPNISQSQPSLSFTNSQFGPSSSFVQNPTQNQPTQRVPSTSLNTRFGDDKEKPVASQIQPHQQSVSSFNTPSKQPQNTQLGEIYNYQKPDQGFDTSAQNEHNGNTQFQFGSQAQFAQQELSVDNLTQKEKPDPSLSSFDLQSSTQIEQGNDNGSAINLNKPSTQTITSTSQAQPSFTLQNRQQSAATGEIYEYNKPEQGLPNSEKKDVQFGHVSQGSFGSKPNNNQESDNSRPTTSEFTQSTFGSLDSPKQGSSTTQAPLTFGSSTGNVAVSRPQLSFHSACIPCGGSILNKKPFGQSLKPNDNVSGQNKDTQSNQIHSSQNLSPQTGSQTFAGVGEQFGGPRKPPSFDQTGYHY